MALAVVKSEGRKGAQEGAQRGSPTAPNGKDPGTGRFQPGNRCAKGIKRPDNGRIARMRRALIEAVSEEDVREIASALVQKARSGDIQASKLVLSYAAGGPAAEPDEGKDVRIVIE